MDIVINDKKVAHTKDVVKFEGERNMTELAKAFDGANGWIDKGPGVPGEPDLDYTAKQVPGTAKLQISIKNPAKAITKASTYKVLGFGSQWPERYQPIDNSIHPI